MNVSECIARQDLTHGKSLFLIRQGLFFHAFGHAAVFLQGVTGYQVKRVRVGGEDVEKLGFPACVLDGVLRRVTADCPDVEIESLEDGRHWMLSLPEEVAEEIPYERTAERPVFSPVPLKRGPGKESCSIAERIVSLVRSVNLAQTTPLEAFNLLSALQRIVREEG